MNVHVIFSTGISDWATTVVENLNGTGLIELTLDNNAIYNVGPVFTANLPDLEILSLGDNDLYERSELTLDFYTLSQLVGLNVSWQQRENHAYLGNREKDKENLVNYVQNEPDKMSSGTVRNLAHFTAISKTKSSNEYNSLDGNGALHFGSKDVSKSEGKKTDNQRNLGGQRPGDVGDIHICEVGMACPVKLPRHFKWVEMSHFGLHLPMVPELVIMTNSTLEYVGIAYSGVQTFKKPIYCAFGTIPQVGKVEWNEMMFY